MANVRQFVVGTLLESDIPCIEGEKYLETFWKKTMKKINRDTAAIIFKNSILIPNNSFSEVCAMLIQELYQDILEQEIGKEEK